MKEILDNATEKLYKAQDALAGGGSRTRAQQDKLKQEYEDAKKVYNDAGGIDPVIPELHGKKVL